MVACFACDITAVACDITAVACDITAIALPERLFSTKRNFSSKRKSYVHFNLISQRQN